MTDGLTTLVCLIFEIYLERQESETCGIIIDTVKETGLYQKCYVIN